MNWFWVAVLMGLALGFNPSVDRAFTATSRYFAQWAVTSVIWTVVAAIVNYWWLPTLAGPFCGLGWWLVIAWVINLVVDAAVENDNPNRARSYGDSWPVSGWGVTGAILLILAVGGTSIASAPGPAASVESKLIGDVETLNWENATASPTNPSHIRRVSEPHALYLMGKLMNQSADPTKPDEVLGSLYDLDAARITIQKVKDRLEWVCPLTYRDGILRRRDYTPGYARCSAETPNGNATVVSKVNGKPLHMKYFPTGLWEHDLERHLWLKGYRGLRMLETHFETDDEGNPWYVVSRTRWKYLAAGETILGVTLVNPMTGELSDYDIGKEPAWVDCVVPKYLAHYYPEAWGMLRNGWQLTSSDPEAMKVVDEGPIEVFGDDGNMYWHVGLMSPSRKDDALVGFFHINRKTGKAKRYRMTVPAGHGQSAVAAANLALKTENIMGVHATEPIPYLVSGRLAYFTPADGETGQYQRLIITDAQDSSINGIGQLGEEALDEYNEALQAAETELAPNAERTVKEGTFTVARVGTFQRRQNTYWVIRFREFPGRNFTGTLSESKLDLPFVRDGNRVRITYMESSPTEKRSHISALSLPELK